MLELVLRIGFSLLVVLGLLWLLAKLARRPLTGRNGGALAVLARQQITRGSVVAVVRVVDRALIVGVTDGQVTLLGETDLGAVTGAEPPRTPAAPPAGRPEWPGRRELTGRRQSAGPHESAGRREEVAVDPVERRARPLDGSALSARTWAQAVQFLRDRTARR